jgi:hypothetical protein
MSVLNQKSILARLLANENITIEQTNHSTAYFDIENRVLGLPHWKDINDDLYGLLIGHEVGHALETPADGWHSSTTDIPGCPRSYVNIVEDIRIEKLVLRRYPGLLGSFIRGYQDLLDRDFFGLSKKSIRKLPFMDRLNIYSKTRGLVKVPFKPEEQPFVDRAMAVETWDDVIKSCREIYDFVKAAAAGKFPIGNDRNRVPRGESKAESPVEFGDSYVDNNPEDGESNTDDLTTTPQNAPNDEVWTDQEFRNNMNTKVVDSINLSGETLYVRGPTSEIIEQVITKYAELKISRKRFNHVIDDVAYAKFEKENREKVSVMIKEFEMRKAAYRTLRARTSDKGSLDVNKLHRYKFDDHLFKQMIHLADAQSHGMVMLIDYSSSMSKVINSVLKQLLTLVSFCKRTGIPFEVYGFTTPSLSKENKIREKNDPLTSVHMRMCNIFELISSDLNKADYAEAYKFLWHQSHTWDRSYITFSEFESMAGTPLNEALLCMMTVINKFKTRHRVQKMNFITLTDGEGGRLMISRGNDLQDSYRANRDYKKLVINHNGKNLQIPRCQAHGETKIILDEIANDGIRCVNYFLAENLRVKRIPNFPENSIFEAREKGVAVVNDQGGYHRRFLINSQNSFLGGNVHDMDIDADASATKIAKEFGKHSNSKKISRFIASKFAEIVS